MKNFWKIAALSSIILLGTHNFWHSFMGSKFITSSLPSFSKEKWMAWLWDVFIDFFTRIISVFCYAFYNIFYDTLFQYFIIPLEQMWVIVMSWSCHYLEFSLDEYSTCKNYRISQPQQFKRKVYWVIKLCIFF